MSPSTKTCLRVIQNTNLIGMCAYLTVSGTKVLHSCSNAQNTDQLFVYVAVDVPDIIANVGFLLALHESIDFFAEWLWGESLLSETEKKVIAIARKHIVNMLRISAAVDFTLAFGRRDLFPALRGFSHLSVAGMLLVTGPETMPAPLPAPDKNCAAPQQKKKRTPKAEIAGSPPGERALPIQDMEKTPPKIVISETRFDEIMARAREKKQL
jgi:hypothetical protein